MLTRIIRYTNEANRLQCLIVHIAFPSPVPAVLRASLNMASSAARADNVQVQMVPTTNMPPDLHEDEEIKDPSLDSDTSSDDEECYNKSSIRQHRKMTMMENCIASFRLDTVLFFTFAAFLCGGSLFVYSQYNPYFVLFSREGAEVFLFWAICYGVMIIHYGRKYIRFICNTKQSSSLGKEHGGRKGKRRRNCLVRFVCQMYKFKRNFNINGKYFLFKMYFLEFVERSNQVYNVWTLYVCQLSTTLLHVLIAVMMLEIIYSTWEVFHMKSSVQRDRQILVDMFVDTFCIAFPLCFIFFVYSIPIDLWEMVRLTFVPMYGLLFKLSTLIRDGLTLSKQKRDLIKQKSTRRLTVGTMSLQIRCMTKGRRIFLTVINSMFFLFYASIIVSQTIVYNGNINKQKCTDLYEIDTIWESCRLEVPFCQNPYVPRCDCAVLHIPFFQNRTLPKSFENMKSLVMLNIYSGKLESLPSNMPDNHKRLVVLHVTRNRLVSLPDNIGDVKRLVKIILISNRLRAIPESIGRLRDLNTLDVRHNNITVLPESIGNAEYLIILYLDHNKLSRLPSTISKLQQLRWLTLNNNDLESLPDDIDRLQWLQWLVLSNNRIQVLPENIKDLRHLKYFYSWNNGLRKFPDMDTQDWMNMEYVDIRHNPSLRSLPNAFVQKGGLPNLKEISMFNTSACSNDALLSDLRDSNVEYSCAKQCAMDCSSFDRGNGLCDDTEYVYYLASLYTSDAGILPMQGKGCNTAECDYDDGDCPAP